MWSNEDCVFSRWWGSCPNPGTPSFQSRESSPVSSTRSCSSRHDWRILASSWGPLRGRRVYWPGAPPSSCGPGGPGATETATNSQQYKLQLIKTCGDTWRSQYCRRRSDPEWWSSSLQSPLRRPKCEGNSGLVFHKINQSGYNLLVQEIKYIKL